MQNPVHLAFVAVLGPQKDIFLTLFTPPLLCISRGDQRLRATTSLGFSPSEAHTLWLDINAHITSRNETSAGGAARAACGNACGTKSVYKIIRERGGRRAHKQVKQADSVLGTSKVPKKAGFDASRFASAHSKKRDASKNGERSASICNCCEWTTSFETIKCDSDCMHAPAAFLQYTAVYLGQESLTSASDDSECTFLLLQCQREPRVVGACMCCR